MPAFHITFPGAFHSGELYDKQGRPVHTLEAAVNAAEEVHGEDWSEVYNGTVGISREEVQADPHWLFHYAEGLDHTNLGDIYDNPPELAVIERASGFELRHLATGRTHWLSDGVDVLTDEHGKTLSPGTPEFTALWSEALNSEPEAMEAYFPDLLEESHE